MLEPKVEGTGATFTTTCDCRNTFTWQTQPNHKRMPLCNLILAAAAFFTGCSPTRLINSLKYAGLCIFSFTTYNRIQTAYLVPAVRGLWDRCQAAMFRDRGDRPVKLAGDGRCDSPGHSAKYCSYSLMDAATSEVLHCELLQVNYSYTYNDLFIIYFLQVRCRRVRQCGSGTDPGGIEPATFQLLARRSKLYQLS